MTKKDNVKVRRAQQKMNQERLARLKFSLMKKLRIYKKEQSEIFSGAPERKVVEITPTLYQAESAFAIKESKQNQKYLAIVKAKQDIIIRKLRDLNKFDEEDWDEEATDKLHKLIAKMEEEEA